MADHVVTGWRCKSDAGAGGCSGPLRASQAPTLLVRGPFPRAPFCPSLEPVQGPVQGQHKALRLRRGALPTPSRSPSVPSWRSRLANLTGAPGWFPKRKNGWPTTSSRAGAARVTLALAAAVGLCGPPRRQFCWCVAHPPALPSAPRWSQYKGQYKASTRPAQGQRRANTGPAQGPVQGQCRASTGLVQGQYKVSTKPVQGSTRPTQGRYEASTRPVQGRYIGQCTASTKPVQGQYRANTMPVQGQYRARTRPVQGQYKANTRPVATSM